MDVVDYIIDTSETEQDAIAGMKRLAEKNHGIDNVSSAIDNSIDEEDAIYNIKTLARVSPPTKEDLPIIDSWGLRTITTPQNWYSGIKTATDVIGKIPAFLTVPVTEAARALPKYIAENIGENTSQTPPIDTAAEYRQAGVSDRFGLSHLTRDLSNAVGIQGAPLANIESKDYPKAAAFISGMTDPISLAGAGADVIAGAKIPLPKIANAPVISLEAAADYVRAIAKDKNMLLGLEKSGKIYELARLVQNDPKKYLHQFKPNKVYENIMGPIDPPVRSRLIGDGELANLNRYQNDFLETIPQDYTIPREELQLSAINELGREGALEAGQLSSAQDIIKRNIPITQPDPAKIKKIQDTNTAIAEASRLTRDIPSERMGLENQISIKKNELIRLVNEQPDLINNPKFREDLQWLSELEVIGGGENLFPKERYTTGGKITQPPSNYTKNIGPKESRDFSVTQEFDPSVNVSSSVKNQDLLDIIMGEQKQPTMIPNLDKTAMLQDAIEKISLLNKDLKNVADKKVPSVNNKKLLEMIDERNRLSEFVRKNRDPKLGLPEDYIDMIRKRNEEPAGYASQVRRLGNKLMEPPIPGEVSTDISSKKVAGRAMERAGRKAQNITMSNMPAGSVTEYDALNKKISQNITLRDLIDKNLVGSGLNGLDIPTASMTGRTGLVSTAKEGLSQYIKPTIQEAGSSMYNTSAKLLGDRRYVGTMGAMQSMNTFKNEHVIAFKIPRNSTDIINNLDMVKAKLKMDVGSDAEKSIDSATTQEELNNILINFHSMSPGSFQPDQYGRINGLITDPLLKKKALADILKAEGSSVNRAKKAKQLLHDGTLED